LKIIPKSRNPNDTIQESYRKALPIRFEVPVTIPETQSKQSPFHKWQMEARLIAGGKEHNALFSTPIYANPLQNLNIA
jgi:hypothetical protein